MGSINYSPEQNAPGGVENTQLSCTVDFLWRIHGFISPDRRTWPVARETSNYLQS